VKGSRGKAQAQRGTKKVGAQEGVVKDKVQDRKIGGNFLPGEAV
jgi:hypothetical protein